MEKYSNINVTVQTFNKSLKEIIDKIEYIDIVINCAGAGDWKFSRNGYK